LRPWFRRIPETAGGIQRISRNNSQLTFPSAAFKLSPSWGRATLFRAHAGINKLKMTANRVSYTLDSSLQSVNMAEETAQLLAAKAGFDEDNCLRISMAVREAAVNAVLHGNAYDPKKKVTIAFENTGQALVITITDQGKGLDLSQVPDPTTPENLLKQSGRGIFLMRSFMDEVRIRLLAPGTEVTMVKNVSGPAEHHKEASK
jgi:serine/threonine-protein kinase RsbW